MIVKNMLYNDALSLVPSFIPEYSNRFVAGFVREVDGVIKKAFLRKGLETNEEFIKSHCCLINYEGDPFEHIWYHFGQPDAIRIISIERNISVISYEEGGQLKVKAQRNYY